jgi:hypothetical protein
VASSRMQIVPEWLPVACKFSTDFIHVYATGGHTGKICMRLAATRVQFICE